MLATIDRRRAGWKDADVAPIRVLAEALAVGFGLCSAAIVITRTVPSSYAATSLGLALLDLVAGLGLIAAGLLVARKGQAPRVGVLAASIGVVWLCPDWVGWAEGPAVARSLAMVAVPFLAPLLLHLATAVSPVGAATRFTRPAVLVGYAGAAAISLGRAFFRDPFRDVFCWSNCTVNVLLVWSFPSLVPVLTAAWEIWAVAVAAATVAVAVRGLVVATPAPRRDVFALLVPIGTAALTEAAYAIGLWVNPAENPRDRMFVTLFVARGLSCAAIAAGLVWTLLEQRRTRLAVARLAEDLGAAPEPGTLRSVLVRSLNDPELEVVYPQPGSSGKVNAEGQLVPLPTPPRVATSLVRNGNPIAFVYHRQGLQGPRVLEREIGAAARLAVDNERLRAAVLTHLSDLRASRARIVQAGDAARQRIERDLHDGAQQRLLSLTYQLRLAHRAADARGDTETAVALAAAGEEVRTALSELREIAHGIHPVILTEAGLAPAVAALARTAPIAVDVNNMITERLPETVERAAYLVVATGIAAAASASESYVEVAITREQGELSVIVENVADTMPVSLADRVGALNGRITTSDGRLEAGIPCG